MEYEGMVNPSASSALAQALGRRDESEEPPEAVPDPPSEADEVE